MTVNDYKITDGIPFVMTKLMRAELIERGLSVQDIRRLTPLEALDFLKKNMTIEEWSNSFADLNEIKL